MKIKTLTDLNRNATPQFIKRIKTFCLTFLQTTTIHGFSQLVHKGLHLLERLVLLTHNYFIIKYYIINMGGPT